jgi:hypothetical protein
MKKSSDLEFMEIMCNCGIHIIDNGDSIAIENMGNKIYFHPGYIEEPELQRLAALLKEVTIKSISKDLSEGYQFHF